MDQRIKRAVLKTVSYSDVFDYPLTIAEIWQWLVREDEGKYSKVEIEKYVSTSRLLEVNSHGLVCLKGRSKIGELRLRRAESSKFKLKIARKAAKWLSLIPTVEAILVTGSLAMDNADKDHDIDLMVLTAPGCLWVTRFWCVVVTELLRIRRRPESSLTHKGAKVANKVCLNLFLDIENIQVEARKRDLYLAHEILQAKSIFDRSGGYRKFIKSNSWVEDFLPNAWRQKLVELKKAPRGKRKLWRSWILRLMKMCEPIMYLIQKLYMRRRQSREVVTATEAMFHPFDYREWVMKEYRKRLKRYKMKA